MLDFVKNIGKNKQLEEIISRIEMNASNNYKDAAQLALQEFEVTFLELDTAGQLSTKQKADYQARLEAYRERMQKFTHKDQKPT